MRRNNSFRRRGFVEWVVLFIIILIIMASASNNRTSQPVVVIPTPSSTAQKVAPIGDRSSRSRLEALERRYNELVGMANEEVKQELLAALKAEMDKLRQEMVVP